jgi:RimJ/RimL family protein N-acetyltransferase
MLRHLPDGTPLLTRLIRADDKRLLEQGLANLSETSVLRRFLSPKSRFSGSELRYLTELDGVNHLAIVAERPTQPARGIIGVARYVRLPEDPLAAEVAIVVADSWQGRGVGSMLAEELGRRARGNGIARFTATMAADNVAAHRLMEKLALHTERQSSGAVTEMVMDLVA